MNELFVELAKQVYVSGEPQKNKGEQEYLWYDFREDNLKRFTELLIREAAKALWTEECLTSDLALEEFSRNVQKINKHFGII